MPSSITPRVRAQTQSIGGCSPKQFAVTTVIVLFGFMSLFHIMVYGNSGGVDVHHQTTAGHGLDPVDLARHALDMHAELHRTTPTFAYGTAEPRVPVNPASSSQIVGTGTPGVPTVSANPTKGGSEVAPTVPALVPAPVPGAIPYASGSVGSQRSGGDRGKDAIREPGPIPDSHLTIKRKRFPEENPDICIAFVSCRRYDLLQQTLGAIVRHMEEVEPNVRYELALVDNGYGSGKEDTTGKNTRGITFDHDIIGKFEIEKYIQAYANYGTAFGLNGVWRHLCRSPVILSIEDDWVMQPRTPTTIQWALQVLRQEPKVLGVFMAGPTQFKTNPADELKTTPDGIAYRILRPNGDTKAARAGHRWFTWRGSNGGILLNRTLALANGEQAESVQGDGKAEIEWKKRLADNDITSAVLVESIADPKPIRSLAHVGGRGRHVKRESL